MIYQLNNETHWELSPELMRELVKMVADRPIGTMKLDIELANFCSALECELHRIRDSRSAERRLAVKPATDGPAANGAKDGRHLNSPADNSDLI